MDVLDVGCGTGIAGRRFQAAERTVLGVEPDPRMAGFASARGLPVEVATFEDWQPGNRTFDAILAAQSWHWIDPVAGAAKAAAVLRPGGRLAIFGHTYEPPAAVAEPFAAAVRRVAPDSPFSGQPARRPLAFYRSEYIKVNDRIGETGSFGDPELWQFDWQQTYSSAQWLELLPTTGGLTRLRADQQAEILTAVGDAVDVLHHGLHDTRRDRRGSPHLRPSSGGRDTGHAALTTVAGLPLPVHVDGIRVLLVAHG
ncbi:class I SAM-dependent methyltransferase [Nocardia stercoris]|uniref:class I SAM-dependent methyltransferase n=1 Tax=Nocardia stercoris TaxID=2483361 RepID=UPI001F3CCD80|nr:class I SAM-dependent methyltransferase [Nocardia stercoris]